MKNKLFYITAISLVVVSCSLSKGDGTHFYSHEEDDQVIYHSTKGCDLLGDTYDIDNYSMPYKATFCTKCMDDSLILKCKSHFSEMLSSDYDADDTMVEEEIEEPVLPNIEDLTSDDIFIVETTQPEPDFFNVHVKNISPYKIDRAHVVMSYGGRSDSGVFTNLPSGDEVDVKFKIGVSYSGSFRGRIAGCDIMGVHLNFYL